jgi:hypothetical protein
VHDTSAHRWRGTMRVGALSVRGRCAPLGKAAPPTGMIRSSTRGIGSARRMLWDVTEAIGVTRTRSERASPLTTSVAQGLRRCRVNCGGGHIRISGGTGEESLARSHGHMAVWVRGALVCIRMSPTDDEQR